MLSTMETCGTAIINRWPGGNKEHVGANRFLGNKEITVSAVSGLIMNRKLMPETYKGEVLILQDTSEFNYNHVNGSLKVNDPDIGPLSDDKSTGVLLHAGLAVSASTGLLLGISGLDIWNRSFGACELTEKEKADRPLQDKESYKWVRIAEQSKAWSGAEGKLTLVGDRENDIYEYLCLVPDERTDVLVRSRHDRRTRTGKLLVEYLSMVEWVEGMNIKLSGSLERRAREAHLKLKWTEVNLSRPVRGSSTLKNCPPSVNLYVVEVLESATTVPAGEDPVHWRLLTTHRIKDREDALRMIEWYKKRWLIEDLFRIMKTKGLKVESIQHHTGLAIKKMIALSTDTAARVLALRQGRTNGERDSAGHIFDKEERAFMERLNEELEGDTSKQRNPFEENSLARYAWVIAVLAGWKPSDMTKRPPGVITLIRGLRLYEQRYAGWKAALIYFHGKSKDGP